MEQGEKSFTNLRNIGLKLYCSENSPGSLTVVLCLKLKNKDLYKRAPCLIGCVITYKNIIIIIFFIISILVFIWGP